MQHIILLYVHGHAFMIILFFATYNLGPNLHRVLAVLSALGLNAFIFVVACILLNCSVSLC